MTLNTFAVCFVTSWGALSAPVGATDSPKEPATSSTSAPQERPPQEYAPDLKPSDAALNHSNALRHGLSLLKEFEIEAANRSLEEALLQGPYGYDDAVALYHGLGLARAFLGKDTQAQAAFETLLTIAPNHTLTYTTSPKATFLFQKARDVSRARRSVDIQIHTAAVVPLDHAIAVEVQLAANPLGIVHAVQLDWRAKGEEKWSHMAVGSLSFGKLRTLSLPAIPNEQAIDFGDGSSGVLLELRAIGRDKRGWEVFSGPSQELPVGFDAPGPLYTRWWVWAIAGSAAAVVMTTLGVGSAAIFLQPLPEKAGFHYRIEESP